MEATPFGVLPPPMASTSHSHETLIGTTSPSGQGQGPSEEEERSYHVDTLVEMMGCSQDKARGVLAANNYNLERAVDILLSEG